jgi:predicted RNase H-like HicB family nuclease
MTVDQGMEKVRSLTFRVVIEEDSFHDGRSAYLAYCPNLKGATTWGYTKEEALKNIHEVVGLIVEDMIAHGEPLPTESRDGVIVSEEPLVTVTV